MRVLLPENRPKPLEHLVPALMPEWEHLNEAGVDRVLSDAVEMGIVGLDACQERPHGVSVSAFTQSNEPSNDKREPGDHSPGSS